MERDRHRTRGGSRRRGSTLRSGHASSATTSLGTVWLTPWSVPPEAGRSKRGEAWVVAYLISTPLLWFLGLLMPLGMLLLMLLFVWKVPRGRATKWLVGPWVLVAAMQGTSALINGYMAAEPVITLAKRVLSTTVTWWAFIGIALGVGYSYRLASPLVRRAVCMLGLYVIVFVALGLILLLGFGIDEVRGESLLGMYLPNGVPIFDYYFEFEIYRWGDIFNIDLPRFNLFYPWATVLGQAGLGISFIALGEEDPRWRLIGVAGGIVAVAASLSRAAMALLIVMMVAHVWLRSSWRLKLPSIWLGLWAFLLLVGLGPGLTVIASDLLDLVHQARPGSSEARDLVQRASWEGFLKAPIIGHGSTGPSVYSHVYLPAGSHSSFHGLLYTGGILTFSAFVFAVASLLVTLASKARTSSTALTAFVIAVGFFANGYQESLYSSAVPCLFVLLWLGGSLRQRRVIYRKRRRRSREGEPPLWEAPDRAHPEPEVVLGGVSR